MTDTDSSLPAARTTRRDVLKKAAIAGAVGWTAPVVLSSQANAALYVGSDTGCCDPDKGKQDIKSITFAYAPPAGPCDGNTCNLGSATSTGTLQYCNEPGYTDTLDGQLTFVQLYYAATKSKHNGTLANPTGGVHSISKNNTTIEGSDIQGFTWVVDGDDWFWLKDSNNNEHGFWIHRSCSTPICVGDRLGSLVITGLELEQGKKTSGDPPYGWAIHKGSYRCQSL